MCVSFLSSPCPAHTAYCWRLAVSYCLLPTEICGYRSLPLSYFSTESRHSSPLTAEDTNACSRSSVCSSLSISGRDALFAVANQGVWTSLFKVLGVPVPSSPIYPRNPVSASLGTPQSSLSYGGFPASVSARGKARPASRSQERPLECVADHMQRALTHTGHGTEDRAQSLSVKLGCPCPSGSSISLRWSHAHTAWWVSAL